MQWESNKYCIFWVCVCSLRHQACKAHASYYIAICGLPANAICSHIFSQMVKFFGGGGGALLNIKHILIFSTFLSETFLIPRRIQRDTIKIYIGLHVKYPLFLSWFNETWLFSTFLKKYTKIKFHENPSIESRVVPCGWTDGRTDGQTWRNQ
jgi:hypothetical protein